MPKEKFIEPNGDHTMQFARQEAADLLQPIIQTIAPVCEVCVVAGSLRRGKSEVHDAEIVVVPLFSPVGLFDDNPLSALGGNNERLDSALADLSRAGYIGLDPDVKRNGARMKRFKVLRRDPPRPLMTMTPEERDQLLTLEIYIASADNFGAILAIRTGDADFTHLMVTPSNRGGLMPPGKRQKDGFLQRLTDDPEPVWENISTPSEDAYFLQLDLFPFQVPAPSLRRAEVIPTIRALAVDNRVHGLAGVENVEETDK